MRQTEVNKFGGGSAAGRARARRRGSIYAVVLAMAILVSLIGLSAVAVGRINLRTAGTGGDAMAAELLALSAVEHAIAVVNREANWRDRFENDVETPEVRLGNGTFAWKLVDGTTDANQDGAMEDGDGDLGAGGLQPARLFGIGRVGDARRAFSVVLVPNGPNQLNNPGIESGLSPWGVNRGDCALETSSTETRSGVRSLSVRGRTGRTAGPQQTVTGKVTSGKSYYVEAWVRMSTAEEDPRFALVVEGDGLILGIGSTESRFVARAQTVGTEWKKVHATFNPSWSGVADRIYFRVETASTNQDFRVDDLKLFEQSTITPMSPDRTTWKQEELR